MTEWTKAEVTALSAALSAGEIDAETLTEHFLDAIGAHRQTPDIYVRVTAERARAEAAASLARARAGLRRGPLDGVPISLKDLFDTAGIETEGGTRILAGRLPSHDGVAVARLARAGMICLGKTHLSELAFSGLGINPMTATPPNRHGAHLAPGGSSSGAAASVALDLAPVGLGSDTGGSVRTPSAWNDLVGLKTTAGLVPLDGSVPLSPTLDTIGPLCRSVSDAALLFGALTETTAPDLNGASIKGARVLVADGVMTSNLDPTVAASFEGALDRLARAGAVVERRTLPQPDEALEIANTRSGIVNTEGYGIWGAQLEAAPDDVFPPILARFRSGKGLRADIADAGRIELAAVAVRWRAETAGYDTVVVPTTPNRPPEVAAVMADEALYAAQNMASLRNTRVGNLLGLCALTVPTGTPSCGLMLMGHPLTEARLLRIGRAIEKALTD